MYTHTDQNRPDIQSTNQCTWSSQQKTKFQPNRLTHAKQAIKELAPISVEAALEREGYPCFHTHAHTHTGNTGTLYLVASLPRKDTSLEAITDWGGNQ